MKGDIRIDKKLGLAIIASFCIFSMADFVSFIDSKSSGGITVVKETMTVGAVVFRMDDVNPSTIYGGTWSLIDEDATIRFGNGSSLTGVVEGASNDPVVPVPLHDHSMAHDHPNVSSTAGGNHNHSMTLPGRAGSNWGSNRGANWGMDDASPGSATAYTSSGGSHTHSVNIPNYVGQTAEEGEADASLDVRGKYVKINVWKRTG